MSPRSAYCIGYKIQHTKTSQMSPWLHWSVMMPSLKFIWRHHFWQLQIWNQASLWIGFLGNFSCFLRSKSRHHQRVKLLWFRNIRSFKMPDFVKSFRLNFGIIRFKSLHQRPELPQFWYLWYLMMLTFWSQNYALKYANKQKIAAPSMFHGYMYYQQTQYSRGCSTSGGSVINGAYNV